MWFKICNIIAYITRIILFHRWIGLLEGFVILKSKFPNVNSVIEEMRASQLSIGELWYNQYARSFDVGCRLMEMLRSLCHVLAPTKASLSILFSLILFLSGWMWDSCFHHFVDSCSESSPPTSLFPDLPCPPLFCIGNHSVFHSIKQSCHCKADTHTHRNCYNRQLWKWRSSWMWEQCISS